MSTTATTTAVKWAACLLIETEPTPCGISTSRAERLPGVFDTQREAMEAAGQALHLRPDAVGCSAERVEVPA